MGTFAINPNATLLPKADHQAVAGLLASAQRQLDRQEYELAEVSLRQILNRVPEHVDSLLSLARAIVPGDLFALVGTRAIPHPISYGLELRRAVRIGTEGDEESLPTIAITGTDFTITGAFVEPFWLGEGDPPGLIVCPIVIGTLPAPPWFRRRRPWPWRKAGPAR